MKKLVGAFILLIVILGLLFYLGHQGVRIIPSAEIIGVPTPTMTPIVTGRGQYTIKIANKKITSGSTEFSVKQNDNVVFHITSDTNGTLHLLGYEQKTQLVKNKEVTFSFMATKQGKYAFELLESHTQLGILTVTP